MPTIIATLPVLAALLLIPAILAYLIPPTKKEARKLYLRRPIAKTIVPILPGKER